MQRTASAMNPGGTTVGPGATPSHTPRWDPIAAAFLVLGFAALYIPTYWDFLFGYWSAESHGHELLVVAVSAWLFYRTRDELLALPSRGQPWLATIVLVGGLLAYIGGRYLSQLHINSRIELTSQFLVLVALVLAYRGWRGLGVVWFALFFLIFAMPLPGVLVSAITMPLKHAVSAAATAVLSLLDYPVGRTGVVITIGQYQLLVAEACAGLQSMFTLEAMGLLYANLMPYRSPWRAALISLLAVPAALAANIVRVIVLVLLTYHFGEAAGQGFVHGFAGIVLFGVALIVLIGLDRLVGRWWKHKP